MTQKRPPDGDADRTHDRRSILTGVGSIAIGGLIGASGVTSATPDRDPGPKNDEIVLGISPSASDVAGEARAAAPGNADVVHTNETIRYAVVSFPSDAPDRARDEFLDAVTDSPAVEYAEPNVTVQTLFEPDDPYYDSQHAPQQVNCESAWETTRGSRDVVIAVVDQGIQYDHPALERVVDDRIGADFVDDDGDPYPTGGEDHGTHVGGIAAGGTDDGIGHAGISDCSLLSVRALNENGVGSLSDIADGIQWSADAGADIITLSLGVDGSYETLSAACEYAADQGALLVGAAGNEGNDRVFSPANEDTVVAVSALEADDSLASFSNTGSAIELAAPGNRLVSSVTGDDYSRMSGTSMATPVVAGVAGLALSAHPDLSRAELREHLRATAVDLGLRDTQQGYGRVDAAAAVETDPFPDETDPDEDDPGECGDETITASASGSLDGSGWWGESDRYSYSLNAADPCSATITLEGPDDTDFDLYVTTDGSKPTRWDHDASSADAGTSESITVSLEGDEEIRLQIHAVSGSGEYRLRLEERGR
ncbi:S8 family serine peptidase [Natrinema longum]|uniref:S8 family serine peptidase n=1 Tax=Natrinema longum TaxID=370324 RepID=A0A8A2UA43_9EURY|nr:S8 family serine peptidase [Natrinema longum]MBZ6493350.1 S8 family serine peptidase [Natrinema longum]QSW85302.1 S8 family serine peptidase [Natrinema longum]